MHAEAIFAHVVCAGVTVLAPRLAPLSATIIAAVSVTLGNANLRALKVLGQFHLSRTMLNSEVEGPKIGHGIHFDAVLLTSVLRTSRQHIGPAIGTAGTENCPDKNGEEAAHQGPAVVSINRCPTGNINSHIGLQRSPP